MATQWNREEKYHLSVGKKMVVITKHNRHRLGRHCRLFCKYVMVTYDIYPNDYAQTLAHFETLSAAKKYGEELLNEQVA